MIRKAHEAKVSGAAEMTIWGSGEPRREFLYVDDCAGALVHLMTHYSGTEHVNVGSGTDVTIREVAEMIFQVVGFKGKIATDTSKPDGTPRKLLSSDNLRETGWHPRVTLNEGLARTYAWWTKYDALVGADS